MNTHAFPLRVYWEDTDAGGVVYHASYLRFMERGRTELLRAAGVDQSRLLAEHGQIFVVARVEIDFRAPGQIDDQLVVNTAITKVGGASITLKQTTRRDGEALADARVVCVLVHRDSAKPQRLSADLRALFEAWSPSPL